MIRELVVFDLGVLGWAVLQLAWQGTLVGAIAWATLLSLRDASPVVRERVAGAALALLVALFAAATMRTLGYALEIGPASLAPPALQEPAWTRAIAPWIGAAWLLGAVACFIRLGLCLVASQRLRAGVDSGIDAPVPVLWSDRVAAPVLVGFLRPVILVPPSTIPGPALDAVLAHELAHLQRGDAWGNAAALVARASLWFHPAAWFLVARLDVERELACDDVAASACGAPALARALATFERSRARVPGLAANGAPLLARVRRLADPATTQPRNARTLLGASALILAAASILSIPHPGGPCLPEAIARYAPPHPHPTAMLDGAWDDKRLVLRNVHH